MAVMMTFSLNDDSASDAEGILTAVERLLETRPTTKDCVITRHAATGITPLLLLHDLSLDQAWEIAADVATRWPNRLHVTVWQSLDHPEQSPYLFP